MHASLWRRGTAALALLLATCTLTASTATSAQAAQPVSAPAVAAAPTNPDRMNAADWRELKQNLSKSSLDRTVEVAGGTRTLTYTMESGTQLVLEEPAGPQADVTTQVSAGGCGWFRLCVYFTPTEQRMILAGYGAALGAAICAVTGPAGCAVAAVVIAVAAAYLNDQICRYRLRVQVLPWVGAARCV